MSHRDTQRLRDPGPLLAAMPYLLEFQPTDCVVIVGLRYEMIVAVGHLDLDDAADDGAATAATHRLTGHLTRAGSDRALLVGYGTDPEVTAVTTVIRDALHATGTTVDDPLRVADGRWWNLTCTQPSCCPPEGTAFEPTVTAHRPPSSSQVGRVDLAAVDGPARAAFAAAESVARQRLTFMVRQLPAIEDAPLSVIAAGGTLPQSAVQLIDDTLAEQRHAPQVSAAQAALVAILLRTPTILDAVLRRATAEVTHIHFWAWLVRHAHPNMVAGPATMLAVSALLAGDPVLARAAISRALHADPDHRHARTAQHLLDAGGEPAAVAHALTR